MKMGLTLGFALLNRPAATQMITPAQLPSPPTLAIAPTPGPSNVQTPPQPNFALEYPEPPAKKSKPDESTTAIAIPSDNEEAQFGDTSFNIDEQDLMNFINEAAATSMHTTQTKVTSNNTAIVTTNESHVKQIVQKRETPKPSFTNCMFKGNITINFNKQ